MFAIRLKELREESGYSQSVLARKLGVRQSTVGMWESGQNKPQNSKLEMLASIFNVSTDYLLGRSDERGKNAEDTIFDLRGQMREDPDRKALLNLARYGTPEAVRQVAAVIDALRATNPDYYSGDDPS